MPSVLSLTASVNSVKSPKRQIIIIGSEFHRCGAASEKARLAKVVARAGTCNSGRRDDISDRLGTAEIKCAFRYDGGDVLRVLKVTNASLNAMRCCTGSLTPAEAVHLYTDETLSRHVQHCLVPVVIC